MVERFPQVQALRFPGKCDAEAMTLKTFGTSWGFEVVEISGVCHVLFQEFHSHIPAELCLMNLLPKEGITDGIKACTLCQLKGLLAQIQGAVDVILLCRNRDGYSMRRVRIRPQAETKKAVLDLVSTEIKEFLHNVFPEIIRNQ